MTVLPDLTVAENVTICRQWVNPAPSKETKNAKGGDPSYLGRSVKLPLAFFFFLRDPFLTLLAPHPPPPHHESNWNRIRMVRIFHGDKNAVVVAQNGARTEWDQGHGEVEMMQEEGDGEEQGGSESDAAAGAA